MMFSKRHYEVIAKVIHNLDMGIEERRQVAANFATILRADNKRFCIARFLEACEPDSYNQAMMREHGPDLIRER